MLYGRGKVSSKGSVVIPKEIRDAMGIKPGDEVNFVMLKDLPRQAPPYLHVTRREKDWQSLRGKYKYLGGSLTQALLEERRLERELEERKLNLHKPRPRRRNTA
jgi:AbrB family looped-hinge helix DNA binding protein